MHFHLLCRVPHARVVAAACAAATLAFGLPTYAQLGSVPVVAPKPPSAASPQSPTSQSPNQTPPENTSPANNSGEVAGTFMADVSNSVRADVEGLTNDLRSAIESNEGNVREKLILINDRFTALGSDLVDRAKETKEQARDRVGEVRTKLSEIRKELMPLTDEAKGDGKQRIVVVRTRVDALHDHLQSASDSAFARLVDRVQSRVANVEDRARSVVTEVRKQIASDARQPGTLGVTVRQGATVLTITSVSPDGAAAEAGLLTGDQILSVNRKRIVSHEQLVQELKTAFQADGNATLMIRRNGRTQELRINLAGPATK